MKRCVCIVFQFEPRVYFVYIRSLCVCCLYVAIPCRIIFFSFLALLFFSLLLIWWLRDRKWLAGGREKETFAILYIHTSLLSFSITDFGRCVSVFVCVHVKYLRMGPFKHGVYTYHRWVFCCMVRGGCWMAEHWTYKNFARSRCTSI